MRSVMSKSLDDSTADDVIATEMNSETTLTAGTWLATSANRPPGAAQQPGTGCAPKTVHIVQTLPTAPIGTPSNPNWSPTRWRIGR
jgi:hypothetical protein